MGNIIEGSMGFAKSSWKGGMGSGALAGICQGVPSMIGIHPFFARLGGGIIASALIKNPMHKQIVLVESTKEAVYQLLGGE